MDRQDLIIRGRHVVTPQAAGPAAVHVRQGAIVAVAGIDEIPDGCPVVEAGNWVVMPGLVDSHVHINEPGRTEWEGFETATRAAAAGGITTVVDMPLNSIPATTTAAALRAKREASQGKCKVDVAFWGGVVPGNTSELRGLHDGGALGFKCFLAPSGVDEFQRVNEADLRAALPELAAMDALLLAHAELPGPIEAATAALAAVNADPRSYATWLKSRPRQAENEAIGLLIRLAEEFRARVHIVHLSSSDALPALRQARERGARVSVETCPHYLFFDAEEIPDGATLFKCAPPIRERENRERLWAALAEGVIDLVVSDHSPCPPEMKCQDSGDFLRAWGGIASLQLGLPVIWTEARKRGFTTRDLARWMCEGPARLAGLDRRKGRIQIGYDADLVVWDPEEATCVVPGALFHRHPLTPYAGRELFGGVKLTFLRGEAIYDQRKRT